MQLQAGTRQAHGAARNPIMAGSSTAVAPLTELGSLQFAAPVEAQGCAAQAPPRCLDNQRMAGNIDHGSTPYHCTASLHRTISSPE